MGLPDKYCFFARTDSFFLSGEEVGLFFRTWNLEDLGMLRNSHLGGSRTSSSRT